MTLHKIWVGCATSNFIHGRAAFKPEAIVLHRTGESLELVGSRCKQPNSFRSAHYCVGANGDVHQYIEEKDTAFHAGIVVAPTWQLLKKGKNPNAYTIGVELAAASSDHDSIQQNNAVADLIAEIADRWAFPVDSSHIVLHREICAGAGRPDIGFDRKDLLQLIAARQKTALPQDDAFLEITVVTNANVRQSPRLLSRTVRVTSAGNCEQIVGVEEQGERLKGNSCWYLTADGNYLWSGATNRPNPVESVKHVVTQVSIVPEIRNSVTQSNVPAVDILLKGDGAIHPQSAPEAIAAVQDLLAGHGYRGLPVIVSSQYGQWTPNTTIALQRFQKDNGLNQTDQVDAVTLRTAISTTAIDPRASEVYLTLVLDLPKGGLNKILSLVAQMEGAGKFAAINPNTDKAGLSFGSIQWAQKPGRLAELLTALCSTDRELFLSTFGAGDARVADGLLNHCRKPSGGVDPATGITCNFQYNLVEEPWISRFRQSALERSWQKTQVQLALQAFTGSYRRISQFAPDVVSERGVAFLLDVANQFGNGGAQKVFSDVQRPGMREADLLAAMAEETVARIPDPLKAGVRARRELFLQTPLLSEHVFDPGVGAN